MENLKGFVCVSLSDLHFDAADGDGVAPVDGGDVLVDDGALDSFVFEAGLAEVCLGSEVEAGDGDEFVWHPAAPEKTGVGDRRRYARRPPYPGLLTMTGL